MKYTKEKIEELVKNNKSITAILKCLNIELNGGNHRTIKKYINFYNIDISHFTGKAWSKGYTKENSEIIKNANEKKKINNEDLFIENTTVANSTIRKRIINEHLIDYKCSICNNNGEWLGNPLILHLDHISGNSNDNRLENLRFLCPNCHQQTPTWGYANNTIAKKEETKFCLCGEEINKRSKKCINCAAKLRTKRKFEVTKEELQDLFKYKTLNEVSKYFNVSRTSIRKRCLKLGVDY